MTNINSPAVIEAAGPTQDIEQQSYRVCWEFLPDGRTGDLLGAWSLHEALQISSELNQVQKPPLTVYHWVEAVKL